MGEAGGFASLADCDAEKVRLFSTISTASHPYRSGDEPTLRGTMVPRTHEAEASLKHPSSALRFAQGTFSQPGGEKANVWSYARR